jgi:basic membrane protein A and related proteins
VPRPSPFLPTTTRTQTSVPTQTSVLTRTAVLIATMALAACGGGSGSAKSAPTSAHKAIKVGIAYDVGGRGDKSFNDAAAAGLERAKTELDIQVKDLEAQKNESDNDRYGRLKLLCDAGYNPIIAVGVIYAGDPKTGPLARAVRDCPTVQFAIVDDASITAPNLTNLVFAEEQGSFLVGAAAALKSRTGHVGFIAGCQLPILGKFQAGFEAGAANVQPTIKIDVNYLSTTAESCSGFNDPGKANSVASQMYGSGADIVFAAAGASGSGVFQAAKASGTKAIGVDSDQYNTVSADLRDVIITSMMKRVDVAIFNYVQQAANGTYKAGVAQFDLKANGVGYATSGGKIDDIVPRLEALRQQIVAGTITVPTQPKAAHGNPEHVLVPAPRFVPIPMPAAPRYTDPTYSVPNDGGDLGPDRIAPPATR